MTTFTKAVSAGSRIYYFDARTDKKGQPYISIAEMSRDGKQRHCIFLHTEDFSKFAEALNETINHISDGEAD